MSGGRGWGFLNVLTKNGMNLMAIFYTVVWAGGGIYDFRRSHGPNSHSLCYLDRLDGRAEYRNTRILSVPNSTVK